MESLKIPMGPLETVNRRRTDNTMANNKRTNNDLQNTTKKRLSKRNTPGTTQG